MEPRGTIDFHNDKDRWQILSRELSQKQELIHQTLKKTRDQEQLIKEKGEEMLALRQGIRHLQTQHFALEEQLKNEELIESQKIVDPDIQPMQLNEIRKHLVSTGLAYKSERMRAEEF